MRTAIALLALLPLMVFLSGCSANGPTGDPAWTVQGTISTHYMSLDTDASVSVTAGNKLLETPVTIPLPDPTGDQNVPYSVTDIPSDTYDVAVTLTSTNSWKVTQYSCLFFVNGIEQAATESGGPGSGPRTFSLTGLSVTGTTTVDFDLRPAPPPTPKVIAKPPGT